MRHGLSGMRRLLTVTGLMLVSAMLTACAGNNDAPTGGTGSAGNLGLFDWKRDPDSIIVRLDAQYVPQDQDPADLLNSIPPCTLWGDGRIVWLTRDENGAQDVLEARVDDVTVRGFLEDIINRGFYNWEDELVPPSTRDPQSESITLNLYNEVRTVRRYNSWPQNGYAYILQECQSLSDRPVRVLPDAGWISAYAVPRNSSDPAWFWPSDAPFTLKELAGNNESLWLKGDLAAYIWLRVREARGDMQVVEDDDSAYHIAIAVPHVSRDAAAPPPDADVVTSPPLTPGATEQATEPPDAPPVEPTTQPTTAPQ